MLGTGRSKVENLWEKGSWEPGRNKVGKLGTCRRNTVGNLLEKESWETGRNSVGNLGEIRFRSMGEIVLGTWEK